jgi:outer membrane lipoprotein carrier protein
MNSGARSAALRGRRGALRVAMATAAGLLCAGPALAQSPSDPVQTLREFVREVASGSASFTQTVTAPDGGRTRTSSGRFEFQRPDRFRFEYLKPFPQLIVADGRRVWIHDPDINQASSRRVGDALGSTPAALLAGGSLDEGFTLSAEPPRDGLQWALARPRAGDGAFQAMRVGFRGKTLAVVEITDSFGQRSVLRFADFAANAAVPAERFRFTPPPGTDVIEQ